MSTSGSSNFTLTRNELIQEALERIGAIADGENPSAGVLASSARSLNIIIKKWQKEQRFENTRVQRETSLTASSEVTGTDAEVYTCVRSHTAAADNKPITGSDWRIYWKKEGSTGGVWTTATAYTAVQEFSLDTDIIDIEKAYIRDESSNDQELEIVSFDKYLDITDKYVDSTLPTVCAVQRETAGLKVYLYPRPSDTDYVFYYLGVRKLEDFDSATNNPDIPVEYFDGLCEELAAVMAQKIGDFKAAGFMRSMAEKSKNDIGNFDHQVSDEDFIKPCY